MAERLFGAAVSADGPNPVPLQPAPIPGSTYVRPATPQVGQNAARLADALGGLNRSLLAFGSMAAQQRNDPNSQANQDAINSLYGKTPEELSQMDWKNMPHVVQNAYGALLGHGVADKEMQGWQQFASEYDPSQGPFADQLMKRRQAVLATLPNDGARAAFWKATDDPYNSMVQGQLKQQVSAATDERNSAIVSQMRNITRVDVLHGATADEQAQHIFQALSANRDFVKLDGPTANALVFNYAQEAAANGNAALTKSLLQTPRSPTVPSLIQTPQYAVDGLKLIEQAQNISDKAASKGNLDFFMGVDQKVRDGAYTAKDAEADRAAHPEIPPTYFAGNVDQAARIRAEQEAKASELAQKREFFVAHEQSKNAALTGAYGASMQLGGLQKVRDQEVPNKEGTGTETVTAKQQQDYAIQTFLDNSQRQRDALVQKGVPSAQADDAMFKTRLAWFAGNGVVNPEWDKTLAAVHLIASPDLTLQGQKDSKGKPIEVPPEVTQAADLYRKIKAANPSYAAKLLGGDEQGQRFLEAYDFNVDHGASPSVAASSAAQVSAQPPTFWENLKVKDKDIDAALQSADTRGFIQSHFGRDSGWEPNTADFTTMKTQVKQYMAMGAPMQEAIQRAVTWTHDNSVIVNGHMVSTNSRDFPVDFKQQVQGILDAYGQQHAADEHLDPSNLYVVPKDGGNREWVIMDGATHLPVPSRTLITLDDINGYRQVVDDANTRKDATYQQSVDQHGHVLTLLRWADGELKANQMSTDQAKTFLSDKANAKKLETYVKGDAARRGLVYGSDGSGIQKWIDPTTKHIFRYSVGADANGPSSLDWIDTGKVARGTVRGGGAFVLQPVGLHVPSPIMSRPPALPDPGENLTAAPFF